MKKGLLIVCAWLISLAAIAQHHPNNPVLAKFKDYKKSSSGLLYKFHRDVQSPNATPEQFMVLDMKIRVLPKDTILRNSWNETQRLQMYITPSTYSASLEEAFLMVSAGDSISFLINADSMWAKSVKQPLPSYIAKGSYLQFTVRPYRIFSRDQYNTYLDSLSQVRKKDEEKTIEQVLKEQNLTAKRTPGGTYYVPVVAGTGAQPAVGQTVKVHYSGYLLNGTKFDSSVDRGTPFEFPVGKGNVIKGWDEGIPMMKVGEKGLLFIPSDQGYGSRGAGGSIPPNSILIFEVELIEVK